jgi:hypothetical protein
VEDEAVAFGVAAERHPAHRVSSMWSFICTPRALSSATAAGTSSTANITPSDGRKLPLL